MLYYKRTSFVNALFAKSRALKKATIEAHGYHETETKLMTPHLSFKKIMKEQ